MAFPLSDTSSPAPVSNAQLAFNTAVNIMGPFSKYETTEEKGYVDELLRLSDRLFTWLSSKDNV